ncbi:MAG: hypothetical protein ACXW3Z_15035, partial [Limisphaerales bacterium]
RQNEIQIRSRSKLLQSMRRAIQLGHTPAPEVLLSIRLRTTDPEDSHRVVFVAGEQLAAIIH